MSIRLVNDAGEVYWFSSGSWRRVLAFASRHGWPACSGWRGHAVERLDLRERTRRGHVVLAAAARHGHARRSLREEWANGRVAMAPEAMPPAGPEHPAAADADVWA